MRNLTALLVLIGALAFGAPSSARNITLPKTSVDAIKSICAKAGGRFSQDSGGYDCATDCHGGPGTDCIVHCAVDKKCVAQVIGGRRPHSVAAALTKPARHRR